MTRRNMVALVASLLLIVMVAALSFAGQARAAARWLMQTVDCASGGACMVRGELVRPGASR